MPITVTLPDPSGIDAELVSDFNTILSEHTVTVTSVTVTLNATTGLESVSRANRYASMSCRVSLVKSATPGNVGNKSITVHYKVATYPNIAPGDQVVYNGNEYRIDAIANADELGILGRLDCTSQETA